MNNKSATKEFNYNEMDLISEIGQSFTMPKLFVKLTGSHSLALVLNQINFWTGKSTKLKDGWFSKSYEQWQEELFIPERTMRRYINKLKDIGFIHTKVIKVKGITTLCFRCDRSKLNNEISLLLIDMNKNVANRPLCPDSHPAKMAVPSITDKTSYKNKSADAPVFSENEYIQVWDELAQGQAFSPVKQKNKKQMTDIIKNLKKIEKHWPELNKEPDYQLANDIMLTPENWRQFLNELIKKKWFMLCGANPHSMDVILRRDNFEKAILIIKKQQ